jgi:hypothetical protein
VILVPGAERRHRIDLYKVTSTNAAGRFYFEHVPPGDYTMFAWEDVESWSWLEPQFMQAHEGRGTPARIGEGTEVAVEVTVTPPHELLVFVHFSAVGWIAVERAACRKLHQYRHRLSQLLP